MDILVAGIAGPVFDWVQDGLKAACGRQTLRAAHHLTPELAAAAREGRCRVVATFDTPRATSIRPTMAALYAMADLHAQPNVLQADRHSDPATLLGHCNLPAGGFPPLAAEPEPPSELFAAALAYARTGARQTQIWPRGLLFDGDRPDHPLPRVISLTGPARTLAYGPYLGFSPGPARLSLVLAASPRCRHAAFAIELHGATQLGRGLFSLSEPGVFAAEIDVTVPSHREELEIRLKLERGEIDGEIGIDQVQLRPK